MCIIRCSYPWIKRWFSCIRNILSQKYNLDVIVVCLCIELINLNCETILRVSITVSLDEFPQLVSCLKIKLSELKTIF